MHSIMHWFDYHPNYRAEIWRMPRMIPWSHRNGPGRSRNESPGKCSFCLACGFQWRLSYKIPRNPGFSVIRSSPGALRSRIDFSLKFTSLDAVIVQVQFVQEMASTVRIKPACPSTRFRVGLLKNKLHFRVIPLGNTQKWVVFNSFTYFPDRRASCTMIFLLYPNADWII